MKTLEQRFFEKVNTSGELLDDGSCCHEWISHVTPGGYGQFSMNCKAVYAHRVAYELHHGVTLADEYVLHKCDNRRCVNPDHLFLGTFDDNMADMVMKERQAHGEKNGHAKLTASEVVEIRASSDLQRELAAQYGVTQSMISQIKTGSNWKLV